MDKQELRNALCAIEDDARHLRGRMKYRTTAVVPSDIIGLTTMIANLTQIVRQEIVK